MRVKELSTFLEENKVRFCDHKWASDFGRPARFYEERNSLLEAHWRQGFLVCIFLPGLWVRYLGVILGLPSELCPLSGLGKETLASWQ